MEEEVRSTMFEFVQTARCDRTDQQKKKQPPQHFIVFVSLTYTIDVDNEKINRRR
jgi:hypothetical protein